MDVRLRFRGIGLLLTLLICSPVLAQDPENEDSLTAPGGDPHSGMDIAIENADDPATQSLPLEELQMFADVFNQIRQGYVESVPDSELFELAVQGMLSGLDPHSVFLKEKGLRLSAGNNARRVQRSRYRNRTGSRLYHHHCSD